MPEQRLRAVRVRLEGARVAAARGVPGQGTFIDQAQCDPGARELRVVPDRQGELLAGLPGLPGRSEGDPQSRMQAGRGGAQAKSLGVLDDRAGVIPLREQDIAERVVVRTRGGPQSDRGPPGARRFVQPPATCRAFARLRWFS